MYTKQRSPRRELGRLEPVSRRRTYERLQSIPLVVVLSVPYIFAMMLVPLRSRILPPRFDNDAVQLQNILAGLYWVESESAFYKVAVLYRFFHLDENSVHAGYVGITMAFLAIWMAARNLPLKEWNIASLVLVATSLLLVTVFLGTYTKEIVSVAVVLAILTRWPSRVYHVMVFAVLIACGLLFRNYWLLVALGYLVMRWTFSRTSSIKVIALSWFGLVTFLAAMVYVQTGIAADFYRESVNSMRMHKGVANTTIDRFLELGEPLGGVVNVVITSVMLKFPVPLILTGSAYHIVSAAFVAFIWVYVWRSTYKAARREAPFNEMLVSSLCVLLSFAATQSLFEPDYGSSLRHLVGLIGLVVFVTIATTRRNPDRKKDMTGQGRELQDVGNSSGA